MGLDEFLQKDLRQLKTPMKNAGEVLFVLSGDNLDPNEITQFLGIKPTSTSQILTPSLIKNSWKLSTGEITADIIDVYDMSSTVVGRLQQYADKIAEIKNRLSLKAVLQVVLWISTDDKIPTPAIGFESEVIAFLNRIGASIDIDTYRNHEEE